MTGVLQVLLSFLRYLLSKIKFFFTETAHSVSSGRMNIDVKSPFVIKSHMAALYESQLLFCTGILVSDKHVLTAATCLKNFIDDSNIDFMNYHAKLGYFNIYKSDEKYSFKGVKVHENYNLTNEHLHDNIGIITVLIIIYIFNYYTIYYNYIKVNKQFKINFRQQGESTNIFDFKFQEGPKVEFFTKVSHKISTNERIFFQKQRLISLVFIVSDYYHDYYGVDICDENQTENKLQNNFMYFLRGNTKNKYFLCFLATVLIPRRQEIFSTRTFIWESLVPKYNSQSCLFQLEILNIEPKLLRRFETSRKNLQGKQFRYLVGWGNYTGADKDILKLLHYVRVRLITSNTKRVFSKLPEEVDHYKMVGTCLPGPKAFHDTLIAVSNIFDNSLKNVNFIKRHSIVDCVPRAAWWRL